MIENVNVIKASLSKGQYKLAFAHLSKLGKHLKKSDRDTIIHLLARYNQNERQKISGRRPLAEYQQSLELLRGDLLDFLGILESGESTHRDGKGGIEKLGKTIRPKQARWPIVVSFLFGGLVIGGFSEFRHWYPLSQEVSRTTTEADHEEPEKAGHNNEVGNGSRGKEEKSEEDGIATKKKKPEAMEDGGLPKKGASEVEVSSVGGLKNDFNMRDEVSKIEDME